VKDDREKKLTPAEEALLMVEKDGPEELVLRSIPEALKYLVYLSKDQLGETELRSLAYQAMKRAVSIFKPGTLRFFAYAKVYLRGELSRHWRELNTVSIPQRKVRNFQIVSLGEVPIEQQVEEPVVFQQVRVHERMELIKPLLDTLSKRDREVLELYYFKGENLKQIGVRFGVGPSAMQVVLSGILRRIRNTLLEQHRLYEDSSN